MLMLVTVDTPKVETKLSIGWDSLLDIPASSVVGLMAVDPEAEGVMRCKEARGGMARAIMIGLQKTAEKRLDNPETSRQASFRKQRRRKMTFQEYLIQAARDHENDPYIRRGQAYFNLLLQVRPALAERVRGTSLDPFHRDERLNAFLKFVSSNW